MGKPRVCSPNVSFSFSRGRHLDCKLPETANDRFCEKLCFLSRVQYPPVLVCTVQCTPVQWSVGPGTQGGVHVTLDSCRPLGQMRCWHEHWTYNWLLALSRARPVTITIHKQPWSKTMFVEFVVDKQFSSLQWYEMLSVCCWHRTLIIHWAVLCPSEFLVSRYNSNFVCCVQALLT